MNQILTIPIVIILVLFGWWLIHGVVKEIRKSKAEIQRNAEVQRTAASAAPPAPRAILPSPQAAPPATNPAFAWNVVLIIVGALIAVIGLINGLFNDPQNSAVRQTVAALWLIQGLIGLLIMAVGTVGATIVHALKGRNHA